jgi:hypothetical protein
MTALKELNFLFINAITPLACSETLKLLSVPNFIMSEEILMQLDCINYTAAISLVIYFLLVFVSYKEGFSFWKKVAPYIYLVLNLIVFILIPVINICWTFYTISKVELENNGSYLLIWIWFYTMFSIC